MALTQKQQKHPQFHRIAKSVSAALVDIAAQFDISEADLRSVSLPLDAADRVADDLTSLLLKAYDIKHA